MFPAISNANEAGFLLHCGVINVYELALESQPPLRNKLSWGHTCQIPKTQLQQIRTERSSQLHTELHLGKRYLRGRFTISRAGASISDRVGKKPTWKSLSPPLHLTGGGGMFAREKQK